ncbi:heterokaryon incompatibility protein-domain-containing protein [Camillea tinctor]|nr:heterokaryon incompatibility protein-domain-containing protein [Camillea tinctor]
MKTAWTDVFEIRCWLTCVGKIFSTHSISTSALILFNLKYQSRIIINMWLINTETFKLEYVVNSEEHSYAILSHIWEDEEVSFQQFQDLDSCRSMKGYKKIEKTVELARGKGLKHAWVDACCIDKSSSAELSEAINSMFKWYADSRVCFAYLSDLPSISELASSHSGGDRRHIKIQWKAFAKCRWFTRGWTLQELISPGILEFYDSGWNFYGTKETEVEYLEYITKMPLQVLLHREDMRGIPVAFRMSWAANRVTTRVEDIAYCLLGIFDINMALLYGEGHKAFMRLQEEICKQTPDLTLFAWSANVQNLSHSGILANSPSEFRDGGSLRWSTSDWFGEFRITNRGLLLRPTITSEVAGNETTVIFNMQLALTILGIKM